MPFPAHATRNPMSISHEHNLRAPLPQRRPYGLRVRMRRSDPMRSLLGDGWQKEHWFATAAERDCALAEMSGRYLYFRPGDAPSLEYEKIDP
jgi:hypothetical protein